MLTIKAEVQKDRKRTDGTYNYISRAVNATEVATGINNALHGDEKYSWFLG